jgi:hypothetical protein
MKEDEDSGVCNFHGRDEKYKHNFSWKILKKEISLET